MKAVILAGGLGTRMREETDHRPKPMVEIGGKPIIWHIMKNLSVQGVREFYILAGYKSEMIKTYFTNYLTNTYSFTTEIRSGKITYLGSIPEDELEWRVTVLDTGRDALTANRLLHFLDVITPSEAFLFTYGDGLADVDLSELIARHREHGRIATVTAVRASSRFGQIKVDGNRVTEFLEKPQLDELINIGFFVLEPSVRRVLASHELMAFESLPMQTLAKLDHLSFYEHPGFWKAMDTYREFLEFEDLWSKGAPWKTW